MLALVILLAVLNSVCFSQSGQGIISGTVVNSEDNAPLQNCNIIINSVPIAANTPVPYMLAVSDNLGKFRVILPYGEYNLKVSYIGFKSFQKDISLSDNYKLVILNVGLKPSAFENKEVTITGEKQTSSSVMNKIESKDLQKIPNVYNDVLRAVQILPGVISNNELSSGYNVRGGNFDDNLIYLNGFEIYRPFLLRQGSEENQTIINPALADQLRFYNGSFPASYGDKMSSALDVNYNIRNTEDLNGSLKADLLNSGIMIKNKMGDFKLAGAIRYSYPGLFLSTLQTSGNYKPKFSDFQLIANYSFNEKTEVEVFNLYAINDYDLTPDKYVNGFAGKDNGRRDDYRGIELIFGGKRTYSFKTGLTALRFSTQPANNILIKIAAARYITAEDENSNVTTQFNYLPSGYPNDGGDVFNIKSGLEDINNHLHLVSYQFMPQIEIKNDTHLFTVGFDMRLTNVKNEVNEQFSEYGDSVANDLPLDRFINHNFDLNSYSAFVQDEFSIHSLLVNAGVRANYYEYNLETVISPRITLNYIVSPVNNISFSWGYYYQPPYYAELRNKVDVSKNKLMAQRSINYAAGWEYLFKEKLKFNFGIYYKDLSKLIPYYIDREKTEYSDVNSNEGFAYGFEATVQGEIIEGMNSWLTYGYLNTQERKAGSGENYHPRLTDVTHSVQIFLQDRIKKHPNWQVHSRLLFNTGYVFNVRRIVTDPQTGKEYMKVFPNDVWAYPALYFRVDMGLSVNFKVGDNDLVVIAEVLNVFNNKNYGGYRFIQVSKDTPSPFAIPEQLSSRFFNIGAELKF